MKRKDLTFFLIILLLLGLLGAIYFVSSQGKEKLFSGKEVEKEKTALSKGKTCQLDSDCQVKVVECTDCCQTNKMECMNKSFKEPDCQKSEDCQECLDTPPRRCFCQEGQCVNQTEGLEAVAEKDVDQALSLCSKYKSSYLGTRKEGCKALVADLIAEKDCQQANQLCQEEKGLCNALTARKMAEAGCGQEAIVVCDQFQGDKDLCYRYVAFRIAEYDLNLAKTICQKLSEGSDQCSQTIGGTDKKVELTLPTSQ